LTDQKLRCTLQLLAGILLVTVCLAAAAQQSALQSPPTLGAYERNPRYLLNPGDVVEVQYRYTPEYNQTVTIQPDSFVSLEIVGDVKIGGLNLEQARTLLLKKAGARLKDPEITMILKEFQKPYFVVAGEVAGPGKFDMREKMTALQAVMLAGGFKPSARTSQVLLFRKINSETAEVKVLNLKNINRTSELEEDLALEAGDMLFVPQNRLAKVERYMKLANIGLFFNPLDVIRR
jgi:polysaccharide export outer membrane protein